LTHLFFIVDKYRPNISHGRLVWLFLRFKSYFKTKLKSRALRKKLKLFGYFIIFSFAAIFKLKVVWQNIVQNFESNR